MIEWVVVCTDIATKFKEESQEDNNSKKSTEINNPSSYNRLYLRVAEGRLTRKTLCISTDQCFQYKNAVPFVHCCFRQIIVPS